MKLTTEIKNKIIEEYNSFKDKQYAGKSLEERKKKDQFFTPATISISMIEGFKCESLADKTILDPCCGSGNLLAACIIAGANPKNIYGNEFDPDMLELCRKRLNKLCTALNLGAVPEENLHLGNALDARCLKRESFTRNFRLPQKQTLW